MNPLGLASIPADVLSALWLLPLVADRLERDTSVLPGVAANLERVAAATDGLPVGTKGQ